MSMRTILVLEDYPITRKMLRIALQAEGFAVVEAATASDALALAAHAMPDLILQDLGLPDLDGFELLRRLRALPGGAKVPIIACTGRATNLDATSTLQAGFQEFLMKPIEPSRLLEVVRAQLRSPLKELRKFGRGRRLLLVEDNPLQRILARRRLEELGFQVELAEDGMDALEKARACPPDVILTDVLMPRLDGFQLCLCVRRDPQLAHIPVLLHSTAYVTEEDVELARRMGAYSLLPRSPSWLDLGPMISEAIAKGAPNLMPDVDLSVDSAYFQRVIRQLEAQAAANLTLARRCARQATHLSLLRAVADALRSSSRAALPLNEVLLHCLDAAGVSRGAILQETATGPFRILSTSGVSESDGATMADAFAHSTTLRRACRDETVLTLSMGPSTDDEGRELLRRMNSGSALLVPIRGEANQGAVLWLISSGSDFGDADWLDFARGLGDQLGQALRLGRAFAQVTASEERFRQLVEGIEGIVWEANARTGRFTYVSPFAEKLLGYPVEEWLSDPQFWEKVMVPADHELLMEQLQQSSPQNRTFSAEYRLVAADGRIVWLQDLIRILPDKDGVIQHLRGMMVDITDRKRIEEERVERMNLAAFTAEVTTALASAGPLREVLRICCEAMVRHLDAALADIWTHDEATSVLGIQASAGRLSTTDDPFTQIPMGWGLVGQIALQRQPRLSNDLRREVLRENQDWVSRHKLVALAGHPLIVDDQLLGVMAMCSSKPLSSFTMQTLAAAATNIAMGIERRRSEERSMEHRRRLGTLTQVAPLAVLAGRIEDRFKLTWASDSIERITGIPCAQFIGNASLIFERIHPDDRAAFEEISRIEERGSLTMELRFRCADEKYRTFLSHATLVKDGDRQSREVLGSWLDVTQLREAEEALRERDEQLRQAQKMESIGRLAGGVAHDFNNLLSVILGYSDLTLLNLGPADSSYPFLTEIKAAGQRAATLTRQLLAFSRKQVLEPRILNLSDVLEGMEKMLHRLIGEDIQLIVEKALTPGNVRADPGQFEQVVLNLAINARDAMPSGGTLLLRTQRVKLDAAEPAVGAELPPGEYVLFTVRDTGCGMTDEVRSRLFEPFFTTKEAGKGTGLGLSTVYGIVRQSGGFLRVESAPGQGSTFRIYLPCTDKAIDKQSFGDETQRAKSCTETLLLVEDEAAVRQLSTHILRSVGYSVLEAANGHDAMLLSKHYDGPVDLLVTDVVMPNMNGRELAQGLMTLRPGLRTLYVSGYTDDSAVLRGIRQARLNFLQKPFTSEALLAHVREALDTAMTNET